MSSACQSLFFTLLLFLSLTTQAIATDSNPQSLRYVSDFLIINLKNRIERPYTVVDQIKSDAPLTVLEEKGKYIHVRTADNKVGWIAKQYTTTKLPKSLIIKSLEEELVQFRAKPTLQAQIPEKQEEELLHVRTELNRAHEEIDRLKQNKKTNVPVAGISPEEHQRVLTQLHNLKKQLAQSSQQKNDGQGQEVGSRRGGYTNIFWFITGVVTLLIGFLLGKIPEKRRQKRVFY